MSRTSTIARPMTVIAPNGVTWTRKPDADSTPGQFLAALEAFISMHSIAASWNWWRDGQAKQERDHLEQIVFGWDNGAPSSTEEEAEAFAADYMKKFDAELVRDRRNRQRRASRQYDPERSKDRLQVLRLESDAAFFSHVAAKPKSPEQKAVAEQRATAALEKAGELCASIGRDLERVIDVHGFTPAERREHHLRSHMDYWRHRRLREWSTSDKRRFKALLAMPPLAPTDMCSECDAPAAWHDYDISLRLFHPAPEPGSQAEAMARAMPGWWERCPACTAYKIEHVWGGKGTLPGFDGQQYVAMLPPLLKAVFGPAPERKPKSATPPKAKPVAIIPGGLPVDEVIARLAEAQQRFPDAEVRRGSGDGWELWPREVKPPPDRKLSTSGMSIIDPSRADEPGCSDRCFLERQRLPVGQQPTARNTAQPTRPRCRSPGAEHSSSTSGSRASSSRSQSSSAAVLGALRLRIRSKAARACSSASGRVWR